MNLSTLQKIKKKRKVIGRGGQRGGTSTKGHKGQKARSGGFVKAQFEGGQTPLTRRLPRRGFNNKIFKINYTLVSLDTILSLAQKLNLFVLDKNTLFENKVLKNTKDKVKILFSKKTQDVLPYKDIALELTIDACSDSVQSFLQQSGGKVIFTK